MKEVPCMENVRTFRLVPLLFLCHRRFPLICIINLFASVHLLALKEKRSIVLNQFQIYTRILNMITIFFFCVCSSLGFCALIRNDRNESGFSHLGFTVKPIFVLDFWRTLAGCLGLIAVIDIWAFQNFTMALCLYTV